MKNLKRGFFIGVLLTLVSFAAAARDWPDDPSFVQEAFGAGTDGHFSRGLRFLSDGQRVSSWSGGEVIWISDSGNSQDVVPGDGLVVVEHNDGFRTSYRGIEQRPDLKNRVSTGEWIGYAGPGNWVFEITDVKRSRIVDPITLLPTRDGMPAAAIGRVEITRGTNPSEISDGMELIPGSWTVVVYDVFLSGGKTIRTEISLYWVGERIGNFRFDALAEVGEIIVMEIPEQTQFDSIFNTDGQIWFRDVLLNAGRGTLELRIRDETDRVISRSWNLQVR
jgi:hypothetical protein